ncbi:MAG: pyridoxamine 5'-phosphate oxidase family protein [Deltaproteobacteria bacterium]|nr:pyridoxamine 5'-phosphate oxidase family protein [Deltaproteobacteria bacterium]
MLKKMKTLIRAKDTCVLATSKDNQPHCSLMSYITDDACSRIYIMSLKDTMKYRNLKTNGSVSILIDTRDEGDKQRSGHSQILALTIKGFFEEIIDITAKEEITRRLLSRHPSLSPLAARPDSEVFAIRIQSLELLEGVFEAKFALMDQ